MKKVKSILFRATLEGKGVVNFDSNDQKYMWNQLKNKERSTHDNVSFAKKKLVFKKRGTYIQIENFFRLFTPRNL